MVSEVAEQSRSWGEELQSEKIARTRAESERDLARAHAERQLCASHSDALAALAAEWREILDAARASCLHSELLCLGIRKIGGLV
jgi:F0F1-type ATP synthase membrane subunit b/b'